MRLPLLLILLMGFFLVFAISCDKEDDNNGQENVPVLSTTEVTEITANTATSGGNITDDGGTTVTARGICWSTNENPTIDDNKTEDGTGAGSFTSSITDLEPNTTYYVRAYATNSVGTGYGSAMSFTTQEGFTDPRDGKIYQTVTIGNQEWMAENLAYVPSSGNYWAYDNDNSNVETYGYLYDWETALVVCPAGWHLPSDDEWTELENYLANNGYNYDGTTGGGRDKIAKAMGSTSGWGSSTNSGVIGNTDYDEYRNKSGFTALPGGYRTTDGYFSSIGYDGRWWSATEFSSDHAWSRAVDYDYGIVGRVFSYKEAGFSVRCLRD